jgi:SAM-dependent methyltransferase
MAMKSLIKKIIKIKPVNHFLIAFFVRLDNFCYRALSLLVTIGNNGVHPKHRILNYHKFFTENVGPEDSVLDIGCGMGLVAYDVSAKAKEVVGIDNKQKNIDAALNMYKRDSLRFIAGDATTYNFGRKFDKIILSNVLEHIEHRVEFLKKMHDISEVILLRVPMINRDWLVLYKKENKMEYRLDETHFIEYTVEDVKDEARQSGWSVGPYSVQFGEFWGILKKI